MPKTIPLPLQMDVITQLLSGEHAPIYLPVREQVAYSPQSGYSFADKQGKRWACGLGFSEKDTRRNFVDSRSPFRVGDLLWVRETFCLGRYDEHDAEHPADRYVYVEENDLSGYPVYRQDATAREAQCNEVRWTPSTQMKKSQSRLTLRVLAVTMMPTQELKPEYQRKWTSPGYVWCVTVEVIHQNILEMQAAA